MELFRVLSKRGFSPEFCEIVTKELNTPWTANRMLGYLRHLPYVKEGDIADEMLCILEDRERIRQKKEMEYYQAKMNELYYYGLEQD